MTHTRTYTVKPDPTESGIYLIWYAGIPRSHAEARLARWINKPSINLEPEEVAKFQPHWLTISTYISSQDSIEIDERIGDWEGPLKLEINTRIPAEDRVKLVTRTEAPVTPEMIARFSDPRTIRIFHYIAGLVTEAGESLDQLKKHLFYGKPLDETNLKEELGDSDWYMNLGCSVFDTTMQEIEEANIKKLSTRYKDKFSQDEALIRDLNKEREVLEANLKPHEQAEPNEICRPPQ